MSDLLECYWCGARKPHMASAARRVLTGGTRWTVRHFCHTDERSCYNECRGNYFTVQYLGGRGT